MSTQVEEQEGLQMSFLDHLDELRKRLIYSVAAIAIAFAICFYFSSYIYNFLAVPVQEQRQKAQIRQLAATQKMNLDPFGDNVPTYFSIPPDIVINNAKISAGTTILVKKITKDNEPMLVLVHPWWVGGQLIAPDTPINDILKGSTVGGINDKLVLTTLTGSFTIYMVVALYAGIALAIPFLFYQVWAFISPGLYKHEKRYVVPVLAMATVFFALGATFAYKIAFPQACDFLLSWAEEGGFQTLLNAEDYLNLIMIIMLGLGIVFQIPTISLILGRIGILTPRMMLKSWRYAIMVIAIVSALVTPTPDATTMIMFAAPMVALYFMSIGIVWFFGKARPKEDEEVTGLVRTDGD
jgi:sec-independent protein translocase protein TatC